MIIVNSNPALVEATLIERGARKCYEQFNENLIGCCEPPWDELTPDFRERVIAAFRAGLEAMR